MNTIYRTALALLLVGLYGAQPATAKPALAWTDAHAQALTAHLREGAYGTVTSVLIQHAGSPVFEYYADGNDAGTLHNTRSVTKTVTGMAVGMAVADGLIQIDTPVAAFFADIAPFQNPDARKFGITVQDLLSMSGPLECDDWNQFSRGNEERMYIVEDWSAFFWNLPMQGYPAWAPKTRSEPYERAFSYCTAGVQILGEVVQRTAKRPLTDYIEQRLFAPLGITQFAWPRNGAGQAHLGGGLELTTRGLGRLAELQRNGGQHEGQQVLARQWTDAAVKPRTRIPDGPWEYGYLWWLRDYPVGDATYQAAAMQGNGGNRVLVLPEFDVSVVITKTDYNTQGMHAQTDQFFDNEIFPRLIAD